MFVRVTRRGSRQFLSYAESYRNEDGKPRQRKIEDIGYLDDLEKTIPNALEHFRALARERTQAFQQQKDKSEEQAPRLNLKAELPRDTAPYSLGYAPVKALLRELGVPDFWRRAQRRLKTDYPLAKIFLLLVSDRFLHPCSKRAAFSFKELYFERFDFELHDVYRALRDFGDLSVDLQAYLYDAVQRLEGMHDEIGFYDVTNFFYEIPYEDEDEVDDSGKIVRKGLRKRGASKEHRKDPIVQMGLLMDSRGLPMAFHKYEGNGSEKTHMLPALRTFKRRYDLSRIVVVADRGLNTSTNVAHLAGVNNSDQKENDGYIFGQTVRGASEKFKEWALSESGWTDTEQTDRNGETFRLRHKSRIKAHKVHPKDAAGRKYKPLTVYQKQIVLYSTKRARKDAVDRERAVAKANALIDDPTRFNRKNASGAAGYVKNIRFSEDTGEVVTGQVLLLDEEKIRNDARYDGYYSIVTSELDMSDLEVAEKYHGLWEIEESFRMLKSELDTRPMFVRLPETIEAHLLICFTALLLLRLLERRLNGSVPGGQIRKALSRMTCAYAEGGYYQVLYRNDVTDALGEAFGYPWTRKYLARKEIQNIFSDSKKQS